jgi:RNA polymerase-binding protein DksA
LPRLAISMIAGALYEEGERSMTEARGRQAAGQLARGMKAVRTTVAKNATTAKVAEATSGTISQTSTTATPRSGTQPDTTPARRARGTGAGAKAATGRSTRTTGKPSSTSTRGRAPAHTTVSDRTPVPAGTDWTVEELAEIRGDLVREIAQRRADYDRAMAELTSLQTSSGDGAGDDQADAGSKTFEREQELSIANNRRDLLVQMERAMERLDKGTYGRCESCSQPIPKPRLQAFPSATLCVKCKQREERR